MLGLLLSPQQGHSLVGLAVGGTTMVAPTLVQEILTLGAATSGYSSTAVAIISVGGVSMVGALPTGIMGGCDAEIIPFPPFLMGFMGRSNLCNLANALWWTGIIILDQSNGGSKFQTIDSKGAQTIGLSKHEFISYNSNLDELNAINQSVSNELVRSKDISVKHAESLWSEYRNELSKDAYAAAVKISTFYLKNSVKQQ